ncbi:DUF2637 domain-containing protein, partial [Streptomyces sp. NPDC002766]|uniref:DUF2637 domain-containing protein n=1 Tax=Streptomyces sp. NPDC002766 TaxID=3154429 RepID=UPI00331A98ED
MPRHPTPAESRSGPWTQSRTSTQHPGTAIPAGYRPARPTPPTFPPLGPAARRWLTGLITAGTLTVAGIGFTGSYTALRELATRKGFGTFAYLFPIGIDAGICVLLALDLYLTHHRIPFPLLRQTAWLLTAATIAFNGAAAWPDPLGVG